MKRIGFLHEQTYEIGNIYQADFNARKNKHSYEIEKHDKNQEKENQQLSALLELMFYETSEYHTFKIFEPKERLIFKLPYFPDRIAHHAIMNIMEPIWTKIFIHNTYAALKNRGIHKLASDFKKCLKEHPAETKYCLKMDIRKFYPSIKHDVIKEIIRKKIKDPKLLSILDEIIDSTDGVPIGNYLSQYFANLTLAYFDHWLKEEVKCKYYFRYADDMVILSDSKEFLHKVLILIKLYLKHVLQLQLKDNYQIYPVDSRGVDFVGYVFYHSHTLLRKSIKLKMMKCVKDYTENKISKMKFYKTMSSYAGWMKYCDSKNLLTKIEKLTGFSFSNWNGTKTTFKAVANKVVRIYNVSIYSKKFRINFVMNGKPYYIESASNRLFIALARRRLPINAVLYATKKNKK